MRDKLAALFKGIFSFAICILMLAAMLVALGYAAAFVAGPPVSESICAFLQEYILPCIYVSGIAACLIGVVGMYLDREYVFKLELSAKESATKNDEE